MVAVRRGANSPAVLLSPPHLEELPRASLPCRVQRKVERVAARGPGESWPEGWGSCPPLSAKGHRGSTPGVGRSVRPVAEAHSTVGRAGRVAAEVAAVETARTPAAAVGVLGGGTRAAALRAVLLERGILSRVVVVRARARVALFRVVRAPVLARVLWKAETFHQ